MPETIPQTPPEAKPETNRAKGPLKAEMEVFRRNQSMLKRENPEGGFVVINGEEILGVWRGYPEALRAGIEKYGDVQFLLRDIDKSDAPVFIPRFSARPRIQPGFERSESPLAVEIEVFARNQPMLRRDNPEGGFVVINGEEILGVWRAYSDALRAGIEKYGDVQFLLRDINKIDDPVRFSRGVLVH